MPKLKARCNRCNCKSIEVLSYHVVCLGLFGVSIIEKVNLLCVPRNLATLKAGTVYKPSTTNILVEIDASYWKSLEVELNCTN